MTIDGRRPGGGAAGDVAINVAKHIGGAAGGSEVVEDQVGRLQAGAGDLDGAGQSPKRVSARTHRQQHRGEVLVLADDIGDKLHRGGDVGAGIGDGGIKS